MGSARKVEQDFSTRKRAVFCFVFRAEGSRAAWEEDVLSVKAEGGWENGGGKTQEDSLRTQPEESAGRQAAFQSCATSWTGVLGVGSAKQVGLLCCGLVAKGARVKPRMGRFPALSPALPSTHIRDAHTHTHSGPGQPLRPDPKRPLGGEVGRGWTGSPLNHGQAICSLSSCHFAQEGGPGSATFG